MGSTRNIKVYILNLGKLGCDENWMVAMFTVGTRQNKNVSSNWLCVGTRLRSLYVQL
jgi:hypothetical protein